jgi:hypothetical protein
MKTHQVFGIAALALASGLAIAQLRGSCPNTMDSQYSYNPVCGSTNINNPCSVVEWKASDGTFFSGACVSANPADFEQCYSSATNKNSFQIKLDLDIDNNPAKCVQNGGGYSCNASKNSVNPPASTNLVYATKTCSGS